MDAYDGGTGEHVLWATALPRAALDLAQPLVLRYTRNLARVILLLKRALWSSCAGCAIFSQTWLGLIALGQGSNRAEHSCPN